MMFVCAVRVLCFCNMHRLDYIVLWGHRSYCSYYVRRHLMVYHMANMDGMNVSERCVVVIYQLFRELQPTSYV
jgi:hypothetical protein